MMKIYVLDLKQYKKWGELLLEDFKEKTLEQMVAELYIKVADLEKRLVEAEKEVETGGVYLDGVPETIQEFIIERKKTKEVK